MDEGLTSCRKDKAAQSAGPRVSLKGTRCSQNGTSTHIPGNRKGPAPGGQETTRIIGGRSGRMHPSQISDARTERGKPPQALGLQSPQQDASRMPAVGRYPAKQTPGVPGYAKSGDAPSECTSPARQGYKVHETNPRNSSQREIARENRRAQLRILKAYERGDIAKATRLQLHYVNSYYARRLAVEMAAQYAKGRNTAGNDGVKSLSANQRAEMADRVNLAHRPSASRRHFIPKANGKGERPIAIPNMIDRVHQNLLVLALTSYWEPRLAGRQYGYRPGRKPIDAVESLRRHLRQTGPTYVLKVDIRSFFDEINHDVLLKRIDAQPKVTAAIRRHLKAGVTLAANQWAPTEKGTPQGGPLSPLLANIVLSGLAEFIETAFRKEYHRRTTKVGRATMWIYADDIVVTHKRKETLEWCRGIIQEYLRAFGLELSPDKTRITHTQHSEEGASTPGFVYLGHHFQHVWKRVAKGQKRPYILVSPSKESCEKLYREIAKTIDDVKLSRKQRGQRRHAEQNGMLDPVTVLILVLNKKIRGWVGYYRYCNAKQTFSRLDHLIHMKLWKWSVRRFNRKTVDWIRENLFSGIELDKKGKPLLRVDKTPRKRGWVFKSPFVPKESKHAVLIKLADTRILTHTPVRSGKHFLDGDWCYWQSRQPGYYPGTPHFVPIGSLRRQNGKCERCGKTLATGQYLEVLVKDRKKVIRHRNCETTSDRPDHRDSKGQACEVSPVHREVPAGFLQSTIREDCVKRQQMGIHAPSRGNPARGKVSGEGSGPPSPTS